MMTKHKISTVGLALALTLALSPAYPAGYFTNGVPPAGGTQYPSTIPLTGNETIPADTNLTNGQNPASESITPAQLGAFVNSQPGGSGFKNALIGGDATTNLFQRGTTGASQTTTVAYGGPDRWAYWSGTSTAMTVSKDTTAGDVPASNYAASFKMARTSGQTGVVPVCMAQEVESSNVYQFQGNTVELDFHAVAGANFSAANSNLTVGIVTGTGTDEGMAKLAFGYNAGGGGSTGWTGQANTISALVPITTGNTLRYVAVATIPIATTEIAAVFCFTPVGTASTNDYVALAGLQLARNNNLGAYVGLSGLTSVIPAGSFERRPQEVETGLQQRYTYSINEGTITAGALMSAAGQAPTSTTCAAIVPFPVTMRIAPTYTNALTASTFKLNSAAANVALSTPFSATVGANTVGNGSITFTASGLGATAGFGCVLVSAAGSGQMLFNSEL